MLTKLFRKAISVSRKSQSSKRTFKAAKFMILWTIIDKLAPLIAYVVEPALTDR